MFALRDFGASSKESVLALAEGFGDESALFRHEIAYIFGQLCSPFSVPSLLHVLRDAKEEEMVRHEAAEALGGIASDGSDVDGVELPEGGVLQILREWAVKMDAPEVVRESCQVAIDMWEVSSRSYKCKGAKADNSMKTRRSSSTRSTRSLPRKATRPVWSVQLTPLSPRWLKLYRTSLHITIALRVNIRLSPK